MSNVSYVKCAYRAPDGAQLAATSYAVTEVPDACWLRAIQYVSYDHTTGDIFAIFNGEDGSNIATFATGFSGALLGIPVYKNFDNSYIRLSSGILVWGSSDLAIQNAHISVFYT